MEVRFTRSKVGTILWGVASIVLGILLFMFPDTAASTFTIAAGWVLTVLGIASLASAFTHWSVILSTIDLYTGLLSLLFGLLILASPGFFMAFIFILLGIYIMAGGFNALMGANAMHVMGVKGSGWAIASAILSIILGFFVITSPFTMASATMVICGVALVYTGIVHVIDGVRMSKEIRE